MERRIFSLGVIVSLALATAFSLSPAANAQSQPGSGQALEIAPPLITLSGNPGQTVKTEISLRNISNSSLVVRGQINDFQAAGEDGTPKIILEDTGEENPYSLKSWISPLSAATAAPKQIRKIPVTIRIPANAAPGGYYGVVRFTGTPPELEDTGVSLSASVGSLVLLTVNGNAKQQMGVTEFSATKDGKTGTLFESTPLNFVLRMKNEGNVLEQPAGSAKVKDMFGNDVATLNFNQPPRYVLPGSVRKFDSPLDSSVIGNKVLFGRYTADLTMTINNNLNVAGNLSVGGTFSARGFQASSLISDTTLMIGGHIVTRGLSPTASKGGGLTAPDTISISGSDSAGTVAVNIGTGTARSGIVANVTFNRAYGSTPRVVVTSIGPGASDVYINRNANGFSIGVGSIAPGGHAFDYIVMQ